MNNNLSKIKNVILYITNHYNYKISEINLYHILLISDYMSLVKSDKPIISLNYIATEYGIINKDYFEFINELKLDKDIYNNNEIYFSIPYYEDELSKNEIKYLNKAILYNKCIYSNFIVNELKNKIWTDNYKENKNRKINSYRVIEYAKEFIDCMEV